MSAAALRCLCGERRSAELIKLGWRATGTGDVVELARCGSCLAAVVIAVMLDASICAACHRVVSGENDDLKACADRDGPRVLCRSCARRDHGIAGPRLQRRRAP